MADKITAADLPAEDGVDSFREALRDRAIYRDWKAGKSWTDIAEDRGIGSDDVRAALVRRGEKIDD